MEEIEYLEEYEEIVMPQLLHNSIEEFLPTADPYDLLPVDPAFDEFIEEDPLCSVYRNDFQFETTQANINLVNSSNNNNNSATGAITTLSPSITNSIVTVSAGGSGSAIVTGDINKMIIVQSGMTSTTTTTRLINVHTNSDVHHLQYVPTEIVETTYQNTNEQQNNIDNNGDIQILSNIPNNNDNNIIYGNNYVTTSAAITHNDNGGGGSGVKVLSCETLGTSAFLNVGSTILTSPTTTQQHSLLTTPIKQTQIIDSPITSDYIRATHSSNNSINTNLSLLGLPLSPPSLQYQLSSPTTSLHNHQQQLQHITQTTHHHQPQSSSTNSAQQHIIATNTTNRSKKLSTIYQNNELYPQLLAVNCGLKTRNSTNKFKLLFRNKIDDNLKGFDKLKKCSMKKNNINYSLRKDESEIIATHASTFKRNSLHFLFKSNEIIPVKPIVHGHKKENSINDNNNDSAKKTTGKLKPVVSKGSLKQYEEAQKVKVDEVDENSEYSIGNFRNQQQLNEEYINDTIILNEDLSEDVNNRTNLNDDVNNRAQLTEKKDTKIRKNILDKDQLLKPRHSSHKTSLKDSDAEPISSKFSKSSSVESLSKIHNNYCNNSSTLLKIDKLATDLIVAKNTSLKLRKLNSLIPLRDTDSDNDNGTSYKFRNMMKLSFSKFNIAKSLRNEQNNETVVDNELKAISIASYKKSDFKLCKKLTSAKRCSTTENINKSKLSTALNKNIDSQHGKHEKKQSSTRTIKSKTQIINDVLNSPKVLRVVLPRTTELEQISSKKSMLMDLNNIEKSLISDLRGAKISIYRNDNEHKELEDPLKGTDIDPLRLDGDEIVSNFQYDKDQLEKYQNDEKFHKRSTPIDEFELFAKQQKLKNINNTEKNRLDKNERINRSKSQSPTLILNQSTIKLNRKANCNENSSNTLVNNDDNKFHDHGIIKLNTSKTVKSNETLTKKFNKKHSQRNMNRESNKSLQVIQESSIILKENDNLKHSAIDDETINNKPEILILAKSATQEKIPENIITTTTKAEIEVKSANHVKMKETTSTTTKPNKTKMFTIGASINHTKNQEITTITTATTTNKSDIFTVEKSANEEKIEETPSATSKKREIFAKEKCINPIKKTEASSTTYKTPEIFTSVKCSIQEKIPETKSTKGSMANKSENPILMKSSNQEKITDTNLAVSAGLINKTNEEINKCNNSPKTPKLFELVRSKRIASRNQSSTDSHTSSSKEIAMENTDHVESILHSVRRSRDRNSNNSDLIKKINSSPVTDKEPNLTTEKLGTLKNLKTDEANKPTELSATNNSRTPSKSRQKSKGEHTKKYILTTERNDETSVKITTNIGNDLSQKAIARLEFPHLTRHRAMKDVENTKVKEQLTGDTHDINRLQKLTTPRKSAERTEVAQNPNNTTNVLPIDTDNKEQKNIDNEVYSNDKNPKNDINATKDHAKVTTIEEKPKNIEKENQIYNINIKPSFKKDPQNLSTFKKISETPASLDKESKKVSLNISKLVKEPSLSGDKEKEAEIRAIKRQNRELKLLEIDTMAQRIFIEPTMTTRLSRSRTKRTTGGNPIQIAPEKPAAKIIRRRQSNILQISRKEYDRVINERKAKKSTTPSPPFLLTLCDKQESNLLKIVEYNTKQSKENKIKKCKIVLERMQLIYQTPKKLKTNTKLSPSLKTVEKSNELPKVSVQVHNVDSNQIVSSVDANITPTTKKRKLTSIGEEVDEPKIIKKIDEQFIQERQDATKLSMEIETTQNIIIPEESIQMNLVDSKRSNDNVIEVQYSGDKLAKSKLSPIVVSEIPEKTIFNESTTKSVETTELPKTPGKSKNNSKPLESTIPTPSASNSVQVVNKITKKLENTKKKPTNLTTTKSDGKIRLSSRFLPLKTNKSNKTNDYCRSVRLKKYKSTPNLNSLNNDEDKKSNNKVPTGEAVSEIQIKLNSIETTQPCTKETTSLPTTYKETEPQMTNTSKFKRKHTELPSKNYVKKKKLSNLEKLSETTSENSSKNKLLSEIVEIIPTTLTKSIVQNQVNSKPQIFIAAPENISRRRNSESNVSENNSAGNSNLDFSIESWFQDTPASSTPQMEILRTDILPKVNSILSTKNSTDESEGTLQHLQLQSSTTTTTTNSQISKSITTNSYWPLPSSALTQTQTTSIHTPQITCSPDTSYAITAQPSPFHIPNMKSINIPAHIVVQTKFLTREQYMSKLMKNPLNTSPISTNSTSSNTSTAINNNLISGNSNNSDGGNITNKNTDQRSSVNILERISDILETQIDTEVRRKMQDLIENKTAEDQLRIERLANIKKIGYTSDFGLQMLVFLQNYFFNTPTVMDYRRRIDNINSIKIGKQFPTNSSNIITRNEDFSFRKIRLPVQSINNNNKNNLQQNLLNRTPIITKLNKNSPINENNYPMTGTINIGAKHSTPLQNKIYNNSTKTLTVKTNNGVKQSDGNISEISIHNLSNSVSDTLNDSIIKPSITLRQSTSSCQGEQINTEVFLNSTNNTCEAAISHEPESILPDDSQTIAPPLLQTEIKEETIDE